MYSIGIKLRIRSCIDRYIFVALQIKTSLDTIDEENTLRKQQPGHGEGTAYERMHTSVTRGLKQNFNKRLSAFRALQEHIHQENHELIKRRVYTVTVNWPNEEAIDRLMETGQDEYITRIAIEHGRAGQAFDIFVEIHERQETVAELSNQIVELAQVFIEMALYDNQQQDEMLDNIERQLSLRWGEELHMHQQGGEDWSFFAHPQIGSTHYTSHRWLLVAPSGP
ncbi:syntaxin-132-like protein [Tanacetum coccineum]